jgi:MSHA biogenesis protein MshN
MSLINQVLQELEKRHAADPGLTSLPPQVRAVRAVPSTAMRMLAIALILVLAAVGAFVYLSGGWPPAATTQLAVTPVPNPVKKQISAPVQAKQTAAVPALTSAPVPATIEPAVQAVLLAPASKLSEELSFNPDPGVPAVRAAKPRTVTRAEKPRAAKSAAASAPPESAPIPAPVAADPPATAAATDSAPAAAAHPATAESPSAIDKQMREMTVQQRAETAFRSGVAQLQDGRVSAAETSFREALKEDPLHVSARQALLGLLLDGRRKDEAEQLLRHALELNPRQPRHAMVLARLEVDRGEVGGAINTLVGALPYVRSDPEYYAFLAALLQRDGRHRDAVDYYRTALQTSPGNAVWLMGLGISLRANDQFADAREAFQRAADSKQLNAQLQAFVERQLREMSPKK